MDASAAVASAPSIMWRSSLPGSSVRHERYTRWVGEATLPKRGELVTKHQAVRAARCASSLPRMAAPESTAPHVPGLLARLRRAGLQGVLAALRRRARSDAVFLGLRCDLQ